MGCHCTVPKVPRPGDVLRVKDHPEHDVYDHWALYVGDGLGIHWCHAKNEIVVERMENITQDRSYTVEKGKIDDHRRTEILKKAREFVGVEGLHLAQWASCREFVEFCSNHNYCQRNTNRRREIDTIVRYSARLEDHPLFQTFVIISLILFFFFIFKLLTT